MKPAILCGAVSLCAGNDFLVGDVSAVVGSADEPRAGPLGPVAAIETVCPLWEAAGQILGADAAMGAKQPGLDVAEDGVNDRGECKKAGLHMPDATELGFHFGGR